MTDASVCSGGVGGFETIVLEGERIRVVVIPALGGRIWELEDRTRCRQWIWHREDVALGPAPTGAVYDDVWAGGWEELFPNDAPGRFEGRNLPDHGEWWTLSWEAAETSRYATRLLARSSVVRAVCNKEIQVSADEASLTVRYRILSQEDRPFHFLFKQHLPIHVTPACRLVLPGGQVHPVDPSFGTLLPGPGPFEWPGAAAGASGVADLRIVPPRTKDLREFIYVAQLPESWCGVDDLESRSSLRMSFDGSVFPYVWLFLSYGGWRSTYTAVLEPCTNMPKDLREAARLGQSACLRPGEEFITTVTVDLGGQAELGS